MLWQQTPPILQQNTVITVLRLFSECHRRSKGSICISKSHVIYFDNTVLLKNFVGNFPMYFNIFISFARNHTNKPFFWYTSLTRALLSSPVTISQLWLLSIWTATSLNWDGIQDKAHTCFSYQAQKKWKISHQYFYIDHMQTLFYFVYIGLNKNILTKVNKIIELNFMFLFTF